MHEVPENQTSLFRLDPDSRELFINTSRNLMGATGGLYLLFHFAATLGWPEIFSPSLWAITLFMLLLISIALSLLPRFYLLTQILWYSGLMVGVAAGYFLYQQPEIILLLTMLPLMAVVNLGIYSAAVVQAAVLLLALALQNPAWLQAVSWLLPLSVPPPLSTGFAVAVALGGVFTAGLGWALSNNLVEAIAASTYHYREARKLLSETRRHRAQISRMLKEQNQANYQLERLNEMLQSARRHAEEAREDRDRFILAVSHELRSPLNFILGFSDLMVNSPETYADLESWPPGLYDDAQEIYRSSTHLLGLINDILDMGQIDARRMRIYREKMAFDRILTEVRDMVTQAFAQKGLWLRLEVESGLPAVYVDAIRIRQVLLNLLNNSLRFTERGGVTLRARRQDDAIQVAVEDTGPGIAPDELAKVFDEFRQVGQENWRRRDGSGLGLSISRRFIEMHGGTLWLESTLGRGACFTFTLPLLDEAEIAPAEDATIITGGAPLDPVAPRPLVVLLSDNPRAERLVQQSLEGYRLCTLSTPDNLPEQVLRLFPRLLLIDQAWPEAANVQVGQLPYDLPVVSLLLPAHGDQTGHLPEGVASYLVKPVARTVLCAAVRRLGPQVRRLLVVDDDPAMLRFLTQALRPGVGAALESGPAGAAEESQAYELFTAASGAEARRCLHDQPLDAVLLDLDLPDESGWQVLAHIRQDPALAQLPVLIVSAADPPPLAFPAGRQVLNLILRRPLLPEELGAALKLILEQVPPVYPSSE